MSGILAADNPVLYALAHPAARRLLAVLDARSPRPYEATRQILDIDAQSYHRLTRRLAQFDLVRLQKARPGEFEDPRVRLTIRISPRGKDYMAGLDALERTLVRQEARFGRAAVKPLRLQA